MRHCLILNFNARPLNYPDTKEGRLGREIDESIATYVAGLTDKNSSSNVDMSDMITCITELEIVSGHTIKAHLKQMKKHGIISKGKYTKPLPFYQLYALTKQIPNDLATNDRQNLVPLFEDEFNEINLNMQILNRVRRRSKSVNSHMNWKDTLSQTIYWELLMLRGKVLLKVFGRNS